MVAVQRPWVSGGDPAPEQPVGLDPTAPDAAADALVAGLLSDPWGQISPSVYETGRLVTLAPWLTGHRERVQFLLATQRRDGAWAAGDEYGLVPTLSATEALLSTVRSAAAPDPASAEAARRGLDRLLRWLGDGGGYQAPDTPAIELIVPALIESLNRHLDELAHRPVRGLAGWPAGTRLPTPAGVSGALLVALRARLAAGTPAPTKVLHSLEVVGPAAGRADLARPVAPGTIGASPAATAAWLAGRPGDPAAAGSAVGYLQAVAGRYGGPVPSVVPIAPFERAWVLNLLLDGGFRPAVPAQLITLLAEPLRSGAMAGGAGLPPDADTTSATLRVLARLGVPVRLDCLRSFETDSHFCTWHGERTPSVTTNAHVLDAFGHRASTAAGGPAERAVVDKLVGWLAGQQLPDGSWLDKWHASPYYATLCCALSLYRFGGTAHQAATAVRRAVRWTLDSQRLDGSWGRWYGTVEETAYAVQLLVLTRPAQAAGRDGAAWAAAARGLGFLARSAGRLPDPPLWHDKDLYVPAAIVRAATLAAFRLGRNPDFSGNTQASQSNVVG